jgi:type VI secretion system secreted protein Hcp
MKSARKSLWHVAAVLVVVGLAFFAARASGPDVAVSWPIAVDAAPQIKMYLRVDGVPGELTDDLHKGCMEVQAYEHQPHIWGDPHVTEGGRTDDLRACRLTVTRPVNKATPALVLQYCKQTPIPTVTLELWREGGPVPQKMMVYTHHECALNAIRNMKGLMADSSPTEELTFVCSAMEWAFTEYDAGGKPKGEVRTQWDGRTGQ